jgi:hypothetical protein
MTEHRAVRSVERFADIKQLYAEMTATPEFQAAFGDPMPLSIIEPGDEPGEHGMPDELAAQAETAGIITTIFDLFTDTRLEPLAAEIAWGFVNSFQFVAGKLKRREDGFAAEVKDMANRPDMSEVFNRELEEKQLLCQSTCEQRVAIETMCDYAAEAYRCLSGWPWSPSRGSRVSRTSTASQIAAADFLRARQLAERDRHNPQGPLVVFSGPAKWHDVDLLWKRLDLVREQIPHMILVTTAQRTGADLIAQKWASHRNIDSVRFNLEGKGLKAAFARNRKLRKLKPVMAVLCEGSGVQANLYEEMRAARVPIHAFRKADQAPDTRPPVKYREVKDIGHVMRGPALRPVYEHA